MAGERNSQGTSEVLPPGLRDPARRQITNETFKDYLYIEKYSRETNGEYSRFAGGVKVGGGNPLHYHTSYEETFSSAAGVLGLEVGGETFMLPAGKSKTVPIGVPHRFFNPSTEEEVKFVFEIRPGHEGFEKTLYIAYGMANDGLCDAEGVPFNKMDLALISDMGDIRPAGPYLTWMNPVIKVMARYKRWMGVEEELLKRYWY